jgi:surface polysaccharide O-acyltransferase-like enzyme
MNLKERESNFELLRIVLMVMIVGIHYFLHGGVLKTLTIHDFNYYIVNIIYSFIIIAVNCFVLLSGYFGIKAKIDRLIKLELQVLFYSIIIFIIFVTFRIIPFGIREAITSITPIVSSRWWFITIYILLFIVSPYVNMILNKISKGNYIKLLTIGLFLCIILPTVKLNPLNNNNGLSLYNFIFLYSLGAYIKKYFNKDISKYKYLISYIVFSILIFLGNVALSIVAKKNVTMFYNYDNIFVLLSSISLFMFFKGIRIKSKFINSISPLVFGVYLIHDHRYVRDFIYSKIFKTSEYYNSSFLLINAVLSILTIFIVCITIEYLRVSVFNKMENIIIEKIINCKITIKNKFQENSISQ